MKTSPHPIFCRLEFLGPSEQIFVHHLGEQLVRGNVVLFAGAGLSFNARKKDGGPNSMPSWARLARTLAAKLESDYVGQDVLTIADYYQTEFGRTSLVNAVMSAIGDGDHKPGLVHRKIVELHFKEIITTNYDTLIERAFEEQFVSPQVVVSGRDLVQRRRPPRIIKMNGCFRRSPSDIVLTLSDFLSYSTTHPLIEVFVTKSFVDAQVIFIGFGLGDPAFRQINERVLRTLGEDCPLAFSFQLSAKKTERVFWRNRQVQIIDLSSGGDRKLTAEERILRVLSALAEFQRLHRPLPPRQLRRRLAQILDAGSGESQAAEDHEVQWIQKRWNGIYKDLDLNPPSEARLRGMCRLMLRYLQGVDTGSGGDSKKRPAWERFRRESEDSAAQALVGAFCCLAGHHLCMPVGGWVREEDWVAVSDLLEFVSSIVRRSIDDQSRVAEVVMPPALPTLRTLLAVYLAIWHPKPPARQGSKGREAAGDLEDALQGCSAGGGPGIGAPSGVSGRSRVLGLLGEATHSLSLEGLVIQNMTIRSFFLVLTCLFGPISHVNALVTTWRDGRDEDELLKDRDGKPEVGMGNEGRRHRELDPTPVEYRLPLLGFHGALADQPWLVKKAAESLWARQLAEETESARQQWYRTTAAHRFRHLALAGLGDFREWPTNRLHQERLEPVLSHLFLTHRPKSTALDAVLARLVEKIHHGWIFGSSPPEGLTRAWLAARRVVDERGASGVPWEVLLILTLALDGDSLFTDQDLLLRRVWRTSSLELDFLFKYAARRLEGNSVNFLSGAKRGSALARYECHLALWLRWMVERIDGEEPESGLIDSFLDQLLDPIDRWLRATHRPEVRDALIRVLATLRPLRPEQLRPVVRRWLSSELGSPPRYRLGLAPIDGDADESLIDEDHLKLLLAFGRIKETRGTDFRRDLLDWVVRRSTRPTGEALPLGDEVARFLSDWLRQGPQRTSFDWVRVAAQIRCSSSLVERVENHLETSLFDFLNENLRKQAAQATGAWEYARRALIADLGAFAPDMSVELVEFLVSSFVNGDVSLSAHDSLLSFLGQLLAAAPAGLKRKRAKGWIRRIEESVKKGGTGRGTLGRQTALLSEAARTALQDNLISRLEQIEYPHRAEESVEWIGRTLKEAPAEVELGDLEEALIQAVVSDRPRVAEASLKAVEELLEARQGFEERNYARLRRVRRAVETRGSFRPTSRFARRLEKLPT